MKKIIFALLFTAICFTELPVFANTTEIPSVATTITVPDIYSQYDIDDLASRTEALIKRVDSTKPIGTNEEQRRQFFDLHLEIDIMDDEIDLLDDKLEFDYKSGKISWDDYKFLERKLDKLEDELDRSEDKLEHKFGIDD